MWLGLGYSMITSIIEMYALYLFLNVRVRVRG